MDEWIVRGYGSVLGPGLGFKKEEKRRRVISEKPRKQRRKFLRIRVLVA